MSLSLVILEIIKRTPMWVWSILAALIVVGLINLRERVYSRTRLVIMPIALGAYSLWGATAAFGVRPEVIVAWLAGLALALAANRVLQWPRNVRPDGKGNFAVPGSVWPLVLMLAIFGLRYVGSVTLVFHHDWARDAQFSLGMTLAYGMFSGLFTARALRILGSERSTMSLRTA